MLEEASIPYLFKSATFPPSFQSGLFFIGNFFHFKIEPELSGTRTAQKTGSVSSLLLSTAAEGAPSGVVERRGRRGELKANAGRKVQIKETQEIHFLCSVCQYVFHRF